MQFFVVFVFKLYNGATASMVPLGHPRSDLPSLLVYPVDYWFSLTPSTGLLLGGRTFLLVLKELHFWYLNLYLFIFCADSPSDNRLVAQPVTKCMLFDSCHILDLRVNLPGFARKSTWFVPA